MRDMIYLGPCPPEEDAVQVGDEGYELLAEHQCRAYIERIRSMVGKEPPGARLRVHWQPHDFGRYAEVVCAFDTEDEDAARYAYHCESDGPTSW